MTLEEKAEEWLKNNLHSTEEDYKKAYLSGAEEVKADCDFALEGKDVEINELKADNDARKFAMTMSEKVEKQLREQIEKMKCCYNCSKWNDGECSESPEVYTMADFECETWELKE